jgi:ADP-ribose pyrophosphatase YjhB (NUDIX family)
MAGRLPYRRHRYQVAGVLGKDEEYLWPGALSREQVTAASDSELLAIYPHRSDVPHDLWLQVFGAAEREIGVLVYSGLFLSEDRMVQRALADKAKAGMRVRILLGDPDCPEVAQRRADEGMDDAMAAKIRNALALYKPLREMDDQEFRLHQTILYNSIYFGDDHLLVHTHVYGVPAAGNPVWHEDPRRGDRSDLRGKLRAGLGDRRPRPAARGLMGQRIDFHNDPDAPAANSIVPSVNVAVFNDIGELLLIHRSDNDNWALPGGGVDIGESLAQAAVRETREESGIECEVSGLSGIYTDPGHVILYTSDGEVRQEFSIVLFARAVRGTLTASSETSVARWVSAGEIANYQMDRSMRQRIVYVLERRDQPFIG